MADQLTIFDCQVLDHFIKPDPVSGGAITDNLVKVATIDRQQELYATVKQACEMGLSIWPPRQDGSKAPLGNGWKERQATPATLDELRPIYKGYTLTGIGTICGKVSGNLECLDFDERGIYEGFKEAAIAAGLKPSLDRIEEGYKEHSPNGVHLLYRCEEISGSTKLATRPKRPEEMKHENDKTKTLIETKGDGGYVIIAPTFGAVNTDGSYDLISGSITTIPTITPEERRDLFSLARTFHIDPVEKIVNDRERTCTESIKAGGRPGDEFNERAAWPDILGPHGWESVFERNGVIYLRRPGKSLGVSATIGHNGTDLFHCFTSSSQFDPNRSYTKFTAYAVLNHHGDFSAAAKELAKQGYGDKSTSPENQGEAKYKGQAPESWPELLPLPDGLPPVKPLEPIMIPVPLRGWLMDIANRMQIPPDFSTAAAVVALGAIIGRGCGIYPKRHDDWLVVPNLWGAVVGRPSLMKTPAISEAQRHLNRLEAEARDDYQVVADAFEIDKEVMKITRAAIGEEIKKAVKQGKDIEEARGRLAKLQQDEPTRRRYQTQDGTTEKIGELLNQNPRGLLVKRDELIGWFRSLDKDGREGDRAFYLEAWNGNQSFTYDRIGRGTLDIPALCVSIFGAITPGPLSSYVYQANQGGNRDDGLLQRFQVFVWPDAPTEWNNIDRFPDTAEKNRAWNIFKALSCDIPDAVKEKGEEIPALRFTPGGQDVFDTWRHALETRLLNDHGLHPAMESHLTKYRKLMPALALIFHLVDVADGTETGLVSERAAVMSAAWCDYLESHAGRIYGAATIPGMEAAREIVKHIRRGAIQNGATVREIWRHQWSRLSSSENVKAGLEVLQEYEWLFLEKITTGGRASELVRLNPGIKL
jgi:hypothetical protein